MNNNTFGHQHATTTKKMQSIKRVYIYCVCACVLRHISLLRNSLARTPAIFQATPPPPIGIHAPTTHAYFHVLREILISRVHARHIDSRNLLTPHTLSPIRIREGRVLRLLFFPFFFFFYYTIYFRVGVNETIKGSAVTHVFR